MAKGTSNRDAQRSTATNRLKHKLRMTSLDNLITNAMIADANAVRAGSQ